jgi:hypothetical protein
VKLRTQIGTGPTLTGFSRLRLVRDGVAGAIPIPRDFDSFQEKSNFLISRPKILEKSP